MENGTDPFSVPWKNRLDHPVVNLNHEDAAANPRGPDPRMLAAIGWPTTLHSIRGGSFLCNDHWCSGYQPGARQSAQADSPAHHTGFRCVKVLPPDPVDTSKADTQ
jgi:formylglycine-generating enzyme required for sulfatase activity